MRERLRAQGLGLHAPDELYALVVPDITAMAEWLGAKPFFMGEQPSEVDCIIFAYTANLLMPQVFDGPMQAEARRHANLAAYNRRMLERYFPEWRSSAAA